MPPPFNEDGYLPPGVYPCSCAEFQSYFGHNPHRTRLISGLFALAKNLAQVGCQQIWMGGSLVTVKTNPGDFDGCFDAVEIDWGAPDLDPVIGDPEAQLKQFGGTLTD
jgi:hypothetical protein